MHNLASPGPACHCHGHRVGNRLWARWVAWLDRHVKGTTAGAPVTD
jgi:hypothetical protein